MTGQSWTSLQTGMDISSDKLLVSLPENWFNRTTSHITWSSTLGATLAVSILTHLQHFNNVTPLGAPVSSRYHLFQERKTTWSCFHSLCSYIFIMYTGIFPRNPLIQTCWVMFDHEEKYIPSPLKWLPLRNGSIFLNLSHVFPATAGFRNTDRSKQKLNTCFEMKTRESGTSGMQVKPRGG